jgi:hypothetical protein
MSKRNIQIGDLPASVALTTQILQAGIDHIDANGNSYIYGRWDNWTDLVANMIGARTRRSIAYSGSRACWSDSLTTGSYGGWSWVLQRILVPGMPGTNLARKWPYQPVSKLVLMEDGLNDLAAIGSGNFTPYSHAHRTILAARSLAAIWLAVGADTIYGTGLDAAIVLKTTANWTVVKGGGIQAPTATLKNTHSNAGTGYLNCTTVGETITFTTPVDQEEARVIDVVLAVAQADNYSVTVRVSATIYPAFTVQGSMICDPDTSATGAAAVRNGLTLRLGSGGPTDPTSGLAIGPATTIVVTIASLTAGSVKFSHIGMESNPLDGPLFVPATANRLPAATVGYTFWSTGDGFPHGYNASTFPLNDANVLSWISQQQAMESAEFSTRVIPYNPDTSLAQNPLYWNDGGAAGLNINPHPNDFGKSRIARDICRAILGSALLTDRVRTAARIPVRDFFLDVGYVSEDAYATGWSESTFAGLFTTVPGGFAVDLTGKVRVRGSMIATSTATSSTIWTMPNDLWPAGVEILYIPARIDYTTSGGTTTHASGFATVAGNGGAVALDTTILPTGMTGFPLASGATCTVSFDGTYDVEK